MWYQASFAMQVKRMFFSKFCNAWLQLPLVRLPLNFFSSSSFLMLPFPRLLPSFFLSRLFFLLLYFSFLSPLSVLFLIPPSFYSSPHFSNLLIILVVLLLFLLVSSLSPLSSCSLPFLIALFFLLLLLHLFPSPTLPLSLLFHPPISFTSFRSSSLL